MVRFGKEIVAIDADLDERRFEPRDDRRATNENFLIRFEPLDSPADLDPGKPWKVEVEQDEVERTRIDEPIDPLGTVGGLDDRETLFSQETRHEPAENALILDQQ